MKYGAKEIDALTDAELDSALVAVAEQRATFEARIAKGTANPLRNRPRVLPGPGASFLKIEQALVDEKSKRS